MVALNLGRDWLFPTKIFEKAPQVEFFFDPYRNVIDTDKNKAECVLKKRTSLLSLVKKSREMKNEKNKTQQSYVSMETQKENKEAEINKSINK